MHTTERLIVAAVAALCALSACSGSAPEFATDTITRGDIDVVCTATGTVNPLTTVLVGTQVSGRIKAIYADYNSAVRQGDLIAEIDPAPFEAQLEQARASLLSARASLDKARVTLKESQRELERKRELFRGGVIGRRELDAEETTCEVSRTQVALAEAQVVQAQASLTLAETNLRYTRIIAPVDGTVISRTVDVGQTVAATFQTPTLFSIAQDLRDMQINTSVDEADIGKIRVGQQARFTVDAYPDTAFTGTVTQIRNAPIVVQNVVTYDVIIGVRNPELQLKPGMTANVTVLVSTRRDVLRIPNAALRFRPRDDALPAATKKEPGVWVPDRQGPVFVPVKTGMNNALYTELQSGTLTEGAKVIVGYAEKGKQ